MQREILGFDHGAGHPLLLLCDAKAPNLRNNKAFRSLGHYFEWPKVADAVIKAKSCIISVELAPKRAVPMCSSQMR
jgi:hypothetical protein